MTKVLLSVHVIAAIVLIAGVVLFAAGLPVQRRLVALAVASPSDPPPGVVARLTARASGASGAFALLRVVVTVLMIVRPGSTTGA